AVADVFDALTSKRPYKEAWTNEQAFETLQKMAGDLLDRDCVAALVADQEEIKRIQARFKEDPEG
ncbi:MAG TPA: phosphohydrolase, partial [Rhodocyclaceae bacterium]|nr:phosphohydrolase [Rhodocyclaceae bacterium]